MPIVPAMFMATGKSSTFKNSINFNLAYKITIILYFLTQIKLRRDRKTFFILLFITEL